MTFVAGLNYVSSGLMSIHSTNYFRDIACMGEIINRRRHRSDKPERNRPPRNHETDKIKVTNRIKGCAMIMHIAGLGQASVACSCEGDHDSGFHTCPEFFDWHRVCQLQDNCSYFVDLNS